MDLVIVFGWEWLEQPSPITPAPPSSAPVLFWPETFLQWVQVVGVPVTAIAVIVTGFGLWLNGRWRHRDYTSERQNHASHIIVTKSSYPAGADRARLNGATLTNTGKEIIKEPTLQIIDVDSAKPLQVSQGTGRPRNSLSCT